MRICTIITMKAQDTVNACDALFEMYTYICTYVCVYSSFLYDALRCCVISVKPIVLRQIFPVTKFHRNSHFFIAHMLICTQSSISVRSMNQQRKFAASSQLQTLLPPCNHLQPAAHAASALLVAVTRFAVLFGIIYAAVTGAVNDIEKSNLFAN